MHPLINYHPKDSGNNSVFSILIPTWNNLPYLKSCIESIRKNSSFTHQLIVHANEAKDGTLEWLIQQPDISFTHSNENIGVCYAVNAAGTLATTDYIVYLNDDMYVCPGWDAALLREIKLVGHNYFFLSATAIEPFESGNACVIVSDYGRDIAGFREEKLLAEFNSLPMKDWQGATWPPNVVHRTIWNLVGGYSIEFSPGMFSDPDFSMKLWQLGVRYFKGVGDSRAYHFTSKSTGRVKKNKGYQRFISKWGMTSSTLTKIYLRRGEPFDGELRDPILPAMVRLKNKLKKFISSLYN